MSDAGKIWDAIVIGSGPNGLSAAVRVARAGFSVLVLEGADEIGGAARTGPLTLPGFRHDLGSAIHPLAICSRAFLSMPLAKFGLEWVQPDAPLAHPLHNGRAVMLERSVADTAAALGSDGETYRRLLEPAVRNWDLLTGRGLHVPHAPFGLVRFGMTCMRPAIRMLDARFHSDEARALLAGLAGHSVLRLEDAVSAGFGLVLGAAGHAVGWPFPRGGAGRITGAISGYLRTLGAQFETGVRVNSLDQLPPHRVAICDVTPRELLRIGGHRFPSWYRRRLAEYRYGPAVFKVDWALDGPIPWTAPECRRAGTVHLGGTAEEIAASERAVWSGAASATPFIIAAQHTLFDDSRAPAGKHTAWAYCHVPNGSSEDMTERIEAQIERFAPGFRHRILARSVIGPVELEARNPSLVGGDICGGANTWPQLLARPTLMAYLTPDRRVLIGSSSTPPGAGVHGICGDVAGGIAVGRLKKKRARKWLAGLAVGLVLGVVWARARSRTAATVADPAHA